MTTALRSDSRTERSSFGWRRLLKLSAVGALASFLLPMILTLSVEPFLLAMAAPFLIGLLVMARWPRAGAITLGVVSLGVLGSSVPFLSDALTHPESLVDFLPLALFAVSTLLGIVAAIPASRETEPSPGSPARGLAAAGAVALAAAAVVSVIAFLGIEDQSAQAGDVVVVAEDIDFAPRLLDGQAGTVSVAVTNRDAVRHTFTIEDLDVDLSVPPNTTQRVTFDAGAGGYEFSCRPHPDMRGTLTVE